VRIAGRIRFIGSLAAILVIAALFSFGCGGGDDKLDLSSGDNNGSSSQNKDSTAEPSDANQDENQDNGGGSAKDADEYASKVCKAIGKYADDIQELTSAESDMADPEAMKSFVSDMVPVFEGISKDMGKINPPDEIVDWHNGMVDGMAAAAELFSKMGDALDKPLDEAMAEITDLSSEMSDMDDPFGSMTDLPEAYQTAFEENSDCQELQGLDIFQ